MTFTGKIDLTLTRLRQPRTECILYASLAALIIMSVSAIVAMGNVAPASAAFFGQNGKIAFTSNRDGINEIYVMYPDGTGQTRLTNNTANEYPSFSPDGTKIVFTSTRDGNAEIYVMDAGGAGQKRLTDSNRLDYSPSFSPDGKRIVFTSTRDGNAEIYVMNVDGTSQTRLTINGALDDYPSFSPDGTKIVFTRKVSSPVPLTSVFIMNADGTGQKRLNINDSSHPSFSPDGKKIVFTSNRDGKDEIFAMNADGTGERRLTNNDVSDHLPKWGFLPQLPVPKTLRITATFPKGSPVDEGIGTTISTMGGTIAKSGFTDLMFVGNSTDIYKVTVAKQFMGKQFVNWQDDGDTNPSRYISLSRNATLTAIYDIDDSLRGFAPLTYTGTAQQPDLTVNALTLVGAKPLGMYAIIHPLSTAPSGTTYEVYAGDYGDKKFFKWEDGSTSRIRTLTINATKAITAFYQSPGKIVVNNDESPLSDAGINATTSVSPPTFTSGIQFAKNLGNFFSPGHRGKFLVYSNNIGLTGSTLASTMQKEGYTWTVINSPKAFTLQDLLAYDAIFVGGTNVLDNQLLIDYVEAGGSVYLVGGTGFLPGAAAEAAAWNTFLNHFNLSFSNSYNSLAGPIFVPNLTGAPVLTNVNSLFFSHGNSIIDLKPTDPNSRIISAVGGQGGLIAVFEPVGS